MTMNHIYSIVYMMLIQLVYERLLQRMCLEDL